MKESLSERLLRFLRNHPEWHNGGDLEKLAMSVGYKGSTCGRNLRDLAELDLIDKELRQGKRVKSIWYRAKPQESLF